MKKIIIKSLLVSALLSSLSANAGHVSWGVSIGFGGGYCAPVYCPPPVVYPTVVYAPQVVYVPQPVVSTVVYSPVVVAPPPVVYYPATTIYVGGGHRHGHRR